MNDQAQILWEKGSYVMNRYEGKFAINLYLLSDFYVETWYDEKLNKIVKLRPFRSTNPLEPYINRIKLNI